jgi:hypothetical protein
MGREGRGREVVGRKGSREDRGEGKGMGAGKGRRAMGREGSRGREGAERERGAREGRVGGRRGEASSWPWTC